MMLPTILLLAIGAGLGAKVAAVHACEHAKGWAEWVRKPERRVMGAV